MRQAAEHAADAIRESILAGRIPAGARIAELDLARQLSVSRTPIREALSRLAAEGLVELSPNRGARVSSWTPEELREIFEVRLRLEPYAVRQAVPLLSEADLAELGELAQSMLAVGRPGRDQAVAEIVELNRRFHGLLIARGGQPRAGLRADGGHPRRRGPAELPALQSRCPGPQPRPSPRDRRGGPGPRAGLGRGGHAQPPVQRAGHHAERACGGEPVSEPKGPAEVNP